MFTVAFFSLLFRPFKNWVQVIYMVLFTPDVKKIKGAAHKRSERRYV